MTTSKFMKKILVSAAGAMILFGSVTLAAAQQSEYNEYRDAVRNEQRQAMKYRQNPNRGTYNEWMDARQRVQREWAKYQSELREEGYSTPVYNDGYYNSGRTVVVNANPYRRSGVYQINMGGRLYNIDNRAYSVLQQAVNRGYQQGYNAGLRDRRYGRYNYYNNSVYMSGTYGYSSVVTRNQYQYYFQQGFQRGYEDGFYARTRYGVRTGSGFSVLGSVLNTILNVTDAINNDDDWNNR